MKNEKSEECHIICVVRSRPAARDQVEALLQELVQPARDEAGCIYYDLYQCDDVPETFYIVDGWRSDMAIAEHGEHPNVTRVVEKLLPLLSSPLEVIRNRRISSHAAE